MLVKKVCPICGKDFYVPHWRKEKAKYCGTECRQLSFKAGNNAVCSTCGKPFHIKESQLKRYNRTMGVFCCRECARVAKVGFMSGEGNHQYGLRGALNASFKGTEISKRNNELTDIMVYAPDRPDADKNGRVTKHRLIVEDNYQLFPSECFDIIDGYHVIKEGFLVHHIDGNHDNNDITNLMVVSKESHTSIHNRIRPMPKDSKTGRFIKR